MYDYGIFWHFPYILFTGELLRYICEHIYWMAFASQKSWNYKMNYQCLLADTQLAPLIHIFTVISYYSTFAMCSLPQDSFIMLTSLLFSYACKSFCKGYLPQSTSIHLSIWPSFHKWINIFLGITITWSRSADRKWLKTRTSHCWSSLVSQLVWTGIIPFNWKDAD